MTLRRDGWIDGGPKRGSRPFAVLRDEKGQAVKFICLKCNTETEPDNDVFGAHKCKKKES